MAYSISPKVMCNWWAKGAIVRLWYFLISFIRTNHIFVLTAISQARPHIPDNSGSDWGVSSPSADVEKLPARAKWPLPLFEDPGEDKVKTTPKRQRTKIHPQENNLEGLQSSLPEVIKAPASSIMTQRRGWTNALMSERDRNPQSLTRQGYNSSAYLFCGLIHIGVSSYCLLFILHVILIRCCLQTVHHHLQTSEMWLVYQVQPHLQWTGGEDVWTVYLRLAGLCIPQRWV